MEFHILLQNLQQPSIKSGSELFQCTLRADLEGCRKCLISGTNPNYEESYRNYWTPLFIAIRNNFHDGIKLLLDHGADINHINKHG
jgi:hypothetical protein